MKNNIFLIVAVLFIFACKKENKNHEASILKMTFDFGEVIFNGQQGTINAPLGTDLKKLAPNIQISKGANIYPPSQAVVDFSEPVSYSVFSEDEETQTYYTVSILLPMVKFTVYDCSDRNTENTTPTLVSNSKISVFKEGFGEMELVDEITTDDFGDAVFYGSRDVIYYFIAEKDGAKNIIDGYVVNGVFDSQESIDQYPVRFPPYQIGDLKIMDTNGDLVVDENDKVDYLKISNIPDNGIKEINVYISQGLDPEISVLTVQPDSIEGKDAFLSRVEPNKNYGNHFELSIAAWTVNLVPQKVQQIIEFDISNIPDNSKILNANLFLYNTPYSSNGNQDGNHYPTNGLNSGIIQRVTAPWNESEVTWNNMPSTTSQNEVVFPGPISQNQNFEIDVTGLIKDMINEPDGNNGFMLKLINETPRRIIVLASSDCPDPNLRPKLKIYYQQN